MLKTVITWVKKPVPTPFEKVRHVIETMYVGLDLHLKIALGTIDLLEKGDIKGFEETLVRELGDGTSTDIIIVCMEHGVYE